MRLSLGLGLGAAATAGLSYYAVKKYRQSAASSDPEAVVPQIKAKVQSAVESARGYFQQEAEQVKSLAHDAVDSASQSAHSLIQKADPALQGQSLIKKPEQTASV